jgi:hypothetical protein
MVQFLGCPPNDGIINDLGGDDDASLQSRIDRAQAMMFRHCEERA